MPVTLSVLHSVAMLAGAASGRQRGRAVGHIGYVPGIILRSDLNTCAIERGVVYRRTRPNAQKEGSVRPRT